MASSSLEILLSYLHQATVCYLRAAPEVLPDCLVEEFHIKPLVSPSHGKHHWPSIHILPTHQPLISHCQSTILSQSHRLQMLPNGESKLHFDSIEETVHAFSNGEFIVVLDSADRENEGDLIIAAEDVTSEKMAFMIKHTRHALFHLHLFPNFY